MLVDTFYKDYHRGNLESNDVLLEKTQELKLACENIKKHPNRFLDLLFTFSKYNKFILAEALKIIDFSNFDECIKILVDLILQRIDLWIHVSNTTSFPPGNVTHTTLLPTTRTTQTTTLTTSIRTTNSIETQSKNHFIDTKVKHD